MKASKDFERTIQSYLEKRASEDALFAERYANPKKNISDCCTYILNTVKSSGRNGFTDAEVFGMAVHYYPKLYHIKTTIKSSVANQTITTLLIVFYF